MGIHTKNGIKLHTLGTTSSGTRPFLVSQPLMIASRPIEEHKPRRIDIAECAC
jgi:hypothetical protein